MGGRVNGGPRSTWPAALWPWVAVGVFALWAARPILMADGHVFSGRLATDSVVTPWFYDLVARQLEHGLSTDHLTGLRHPEPLARAREFPSDWDARLMAPLSWWAEWPRSWGLVQAAVLLINGLGTALLARGLGARGPGIVVAGILGVVCRPVWKDLIMARMNAAFPGLALGALGAWLWTLRSRGTGLGPALLATALGVAGSLVYPPFVALLVPFGVVFGLETGARARWSGRLRAVVVVVVVAMLVVPEMVDIAEAGLSRTVDCFHLICPGIHNTVTADRIFLWTPDGMGGLSASGSAGAALLLWPLVVFDRRRWAMGAAAAGAATLVFLALGPCASWAPSDAMHLAALPFGWDRWHWFVSCKLEAIHDYNRLLTLGVLLAGVLGGLGVEAVWGRGPWTTGRTLRRLAVGVLAGAVVGHAQWLVLNESLSPTKWHEASPPLVARHIQQTPLDQRGPVLELPFDKSVQFLSILAEPSVPRGNPLRFIDPPPIPNTFWTWAYALGKGQEVMAEPTLAEVRDSGVRWVYFDEDRCGGAVRTACTPQVLASLRRVLGAPRRSGTLLVWHVEGP